MDRYGNAIYLTPMALGALASIFAAAWRFLGVRAERNRASRRWMHSACCRDGSEKSTMRRNCGNRG